ncbi:hypothetical protein CSKR_103967 [Clonorchis sinensis]|uniref:Uncharacterized protein n=1 Tax=Clonorchis sinensis TaxID=79923 RepID=A0A3R7G2E7_CLOSI|nr:hypothetical protein CSKR_103967 [Clonorchis sinensis]
MQILERSALLDINPKVRIRYVDDTCIISKRTRTNISEKDEGRLNDGKHQINASSLTGSSSRKSHIKRGTETGKSNSRLEYETEQERANRTEEEKLLEIRRQVRKKYTLNCALTISPRMEPKRLQANSQAGRSDQQPSERERVIQENSKYPYLCEALYTFFS